MGYKALITVDLPEIKKDTRAKFYEVLEKEKWNKIENPTTAWEVSFSDGGTRSKAIELLEDDLVKAKRISCANKVQYVIQVCEEDVQIGFL